MKATTILYRLTSALLLLSPTASSFGPFLPNKIRGTKLSMTENAKKTEEPAAKPDAADNPLNTKRFESEHTMGDGENALKYKAVADWITLRKINKPVAEMFFTAYFLQPGDASRPITFVFNGGPGAASAYMHMGALGPKRVSLGTNGELPPPPTKVVDNDETWLGFTDLVFIDPIGTGFSRSLDRSKKAKEAEETEGKGPQENAEFWDIDRDLSSLGEFIRRFLSSNGRWSSPVFIAGESYGGYRVAKLARRLQDGLGVGLNGAILISPAIEVDALTGNDYDLTYWLETVPAYAATALHHKRGDHGEKSLEEVLADAEAFARDDLSRWLIMGSVLGSAEIDRIAQRMSNLIGIDAAVLLRSNGRIDSTTYVRELLRDERRLCGHYDASLTTTDPYPDRPTYQGPDPTLAAIDRYYTGAIHQHLLGTLGVESDLDYQLLRLDINGKWKDDKRKHVFDKTQGAMDDLRYGMSLNEHMKVFVCHGVYDLVTPYFHSERLVGLMKLTEEQRERSMTTRHYEGGHMFYSWDESRRAFRNDIQKLYAEATGSVDV
uniref:Carboxypeptidase n=1 Tax=Corethron hystrix TaxID=216773 RepID=A0A7S1BL93_9STRA|mmetsp:Transcript_30157/g.69141  ORF Transcript_30157/g.69141 Transcript_30157/m.69141 type:complete len:549 (+) Transcript_30157:146-1792(+)|eukprot:CAMPEP_0113298558 /NCGR_PEP_ID=MMETSP0010_2-20120614/952_1 /TAXON_ID=216773 ORGANISM="Corethron hystrix, Strain 308" /NCGR_SAMPLE_ID=MMETSP0010_2 /ASSEMBLY_ACC=CAM_ASM_000155 /LENGTH=548 /DNA_ID=CAMNT_0000151631 /DNA_START=63 /DNA_END=1709 /DNA_ORIENTATION=- /assembly_acc=CAM_ASM_000155